MGEKEEVREEERAPAFQYVISTPPASAPVALNPPPPGPSPARAVVPCSSEGTSGPTNCRQTPPGQQPSRTCEILEDQWRAAGLATYDL